MSGRKWCYQSAAAEARKYSTYTDFKNGSRGAFKWAVRNEVIKEITAFMYEAEGVRHPPGYWTKDRCMFIASYYEVLSEFIQKEWLCYRRCSDQGFLEEATSHMYRDERLPNGHWKVKQNVIDEALKYRTRADWERGHRMSYSAAWKNDWLDDPEVTGHMKPVTAKPAGYWEDESNWPELIESARKFSNRRDWKEGDFTPYNTARQIGGRLWKDCVAHMDRYKGAKSDAVYGWLVIEAPDDVVVPLPGFRLIKTGRTSQNQGDKRPRSTMSKNKMRGEIIAVCATSEGDAPYFESVLQSLGTDAGVPYWYDGYTEFRLVSDAELEEIRSLLGAHESALAMAA